jgi:pyrimidine-specific ribonucleoside hydrolase
MKKTTFYLLFLFLTIASQAQPLPVKIKHTIIIDTDCAIDDMRAISLLLARSEITVKAILVSDGSLSPSDGVIKISSLLNEFKRTDIGVARGEVLNGVNPPWREFNRQINWGNVPGDLIVGFNAVDYMANVLKITDEKIILVCLGPLTNIGLLIKKNPEILSRVERIIWYNESLIPLKGFNYECDKDAADLVFRSKMRIDVISNLNNNLAVFDTSFLNDCSTGKTQLAKILYKVHSQNIVLEKLKQNHFRFCDDLVAVYLTNPNLFSINTSTDKLNVRFNQNYNLSGVKEAIRDMIKGVYYSESNVVFNRFPVQREMFSYDVRPIIDSAISRYGIDEWKANVMTDEFHGHLGVFSIVGAKMGIRAREYFGVGPDELDVTTFAGSRPPYSCLNDGIQVSTGATLGMGTIHLFVDSVVSPKAIFKFKGRSVQISLKREYLDKVDADINEGIVKFGLMDDGYWKLIRSNALKYWLEWDRNEIFDVVERK